MGFQPADVTPGDVLLFHGKSFVSWAIRVVDGTEVNHAAVAALEGALQGRRRGELVTPGDLLRTPSLKQVGRLG